MNVDHRMREVVTVAPFTGRDASGDPTYGAQTTMSAWIVRETTTVRLDDGSEVESVTKVLTPASSVIGKADRVWLPGANTANANEARTAITIGPVRSLDGDVVMNRTFL